MIKTSSYILEIKTTTFGTLITENRRIENLRQEIVVILGEELSIEFIQSLRGKHSMSYDATLEFIKYLALNDLSKEQIKDM